MKQKFLSLIFIFGVGAVCYGVVSYEKIDGTKLRRTDVIEVTKSELLASKTEYQKDIAWQDTILVEAQKQHDDQVARLQVLIDEVDARLAQLN